MNEALAKEFEAELKWFRAVIDTRFKLYFNLETAFEDIYAHPLPDLSNSVTPYAQLVKGNQFGFEERLAIALCLTPHMQPQLLDVFFTKNKTFDRNFVEFGGYQNGSMGGFLPTGETLLFILSGKNLLQRLKTLHLLHPHHFLFKNRILESVAIQPHTPAHNNLIRLSPEIEAQLIWNRPYRPEFGSKFPARRLQTHQEWKDLVLPLHTLNQIKEILSWIQHGHTLMQDWGMEKKLRPGHRSLFYGPPGTGKTLTAALLGKVSKQDVYRVDLSLVVSKYIGETEKNLAKVFDQAEHRDWILFFDEADALFGKRSQVQDAHDRYANQEVSYLLQRIETFNGVVLLASNLRSNLDEAFSRRFESIIHFPMPRSSERLKLWEQGFSAKARQSLMKEVNLSQIAKQYELSGGAIMNVIRYISLKSIEKNQNISMADVREGISREYGKDGRTV